MKNLNNLNIMALAFGCALFIASCDKSETETELQKTDTLEEGFQSKTGNSDSASEDTSEVLTPLLQIEYDGALSREEVVASFDKVVDEFLKKSGNTERSSTEWYYRVHVYTGTQSNNDTDGDVWASVFFLTDQGHRHLSWMKLDHRWPHNDHEGGWETYLFRSPVQNPSINWLEAESATLALKGKDGWYVRMLDIHIHSGDQSATATGSTHIYSDPEVWLDNATRSGWDFWSTGRVGNDRMNF